MSYRHALTDTAIRAVKPAEKAVKLCKRSTNPI